METQIAEIEELLKLGRALGPGKRYLIRYDGRLSIKNRAGLAKWPGGRPEVVARLDAMDCLHGLTSRKWNQICEKLRANEDADI